MAVEPFPFATVEELKQRWPDFPPGGEAYAEVILEDVSQFILDTCPTAADVSANTRRRIVCAVARRSVQTTDTEMLGMSSMQETAGGVSRSWSPSNPHGDFYLTKAEKTALGCGRQKAFGVDIAGGAVSVHLPWCSLNFGATYCSCGADIAGEPIYEGG